MVCLIGAASGDGRAAPSRVVSINACADQLLLALADPSQIAALTRYAEDPAMSAYREQARALRKIDGAAEEVLKLKPDLVLAGTFTRRATRERLADFGIRVETFKPARNLDDVRDLIVRVADAIGQPERGRQRIAELDAALEAGRSDASGLTALNLQRRGFVAGAGTLLDDLLHRLGVTNAAEQLGISQVGRTTLEHVVKLDPDVLIVSDGIDRAEDQGAALLLHPALASAMPDARRLVLPSRYIVCGGPQNAEALRILRSEFAKVRAAKQRQ